MKYSNMLLFGFVLLALAACSPAIPEPTETIVPSETPLPTNTPTITITPSPTLTPTITTTPTPSPTPLAGAGGLLVQCGGFFRYDLISNEYLRIPEQSEIFAEQRIKTQLKALGIPYTFVDSWNLPDAYLKPCCIDFLAVSPKNDSFLLIQYGGVERIIRVSIDDSAIRDVLWGDGLRHGEPTGHDIIVNNDSGEVFLEQWQDDNGAYSQSGDIYVISFADGSVSNLTETQSLVQALSVSPNGMQVSYSTTGKGVWIYDRYTENHNLVYKYFGQIPVTDWHPADDVLLFWDGGGGVYTIDISGDNLLKLNTGIDNIGLITYPHWTPDGKIAATIKIDGKIQQWAIIDSLTGEYQTYEIPFDTVRSASSRFNWSQDGKWFTTYIFSGQGQHISSHSILCNREDAKCFELNKYPEYADFGCSPRTTWIVTDNQLFP